MKRRRAQVLMWLVALALAGVGGLSYVCPVDFVVARGDDWLVLVSVRDGNLRSVGLSAELNQSSDEPSLLDEHARVWTEIPTWWFLCRTYHVGLSDGTPVHELAISGTLFAPLFALACLVFVVRPACRNAWRLKVVGREIFRPSDRFVVPRGRRFFRRCVLMLVASIAMLLTGAWCMSYTWLPNRLDDWVRGVSDNTVSFYWSPKFSYVSGKLQSKPFVVWIRDGRIEVQFVSVPHDIASIPREDYTHLPSRGFRWAGFVWHRDGLVSEEFALAFWQSKFPSQQGVTNPEDYTHRDAARLSVGSPCWLLCLLAAAWPVMALVRGPLRRARATAATCCHRCGYDLTGNVSGRCPECGRALAASGAGRYATWAHTF